MNDSDTCESSVSEHHLAHYASHGRLSIAGTEGVCVNDSHEEVAGYDDVQNTNDHGRLSIAGTPRGVMMHCKWMMNLQPVFMGGLALQKLKGWV